MGLVYEPVEGVYEFGPYQAIADYTFSDANQHYFQVSDVPEGATHVRCLVYTLPYSGATVMRVHFTSAGSPYLEDSIYHYVYEAGTANYKSDHVIVSLDSQNRVGCYSPTGQGKIYIKVLGFYLPA